MTGQSEEMNSARSLSPDCRDVLHLLGRGAVPGQIAGILHLPAAQVENCLDVLKTHYQVADLRHLRLRILLMQGRE